MTEFESCGTTNPENKESKEGRLNFKIAVVSSGRDRKRGEKVLNQDSYFLFKDSRILVAGVFDGVGGSKEGQKAAKIASEIGKARAKKKSKEIARKKDLTIELFNILFDVNDTILTEKIDGMTTATVIGILRESKKAVIAHIADSRAYILRPNQSLELITVDQGVAYAEGYEDEEIRKSLDFFDNIIDLDEIEDEEIRRKCEDYFRDRNLILQCLGQKTSISLVSYNLDLERGDIIILCTDGLSDNLTKNEIEEILRKNEKNPKKAASKLLKAAKKRAGEETIRSKDDDITIIVLKLS